MEDYFANSKYKIKDVEFSDNSDESDGMLFTKYSNPTDASNDVNAESAAVKFFETLPKQKFKNGQKLFNRRNIESDLGDGSFSTSYVLSLVQTNIQDLTSETENVITYEDESPAPKNQKIGLKVYNTVALASQRKLDYETMEWTNNLAKLVSEVDLWSQFSGKNDHLCQLYAVYEEIAGEKVYLEMELGDIGLIAKFQEHERIYKYNPDFLTTCGQTFNAGSESENLIQGLKHIFSNLIDGLEYLHSQKIAHRDLKVQNFILCSNNPNTAENTENQQNEAEYSQETANKDFPIVAKWIDFNSAKLMDGEDNKCYDTEGTLNFCAPEEIYGVNDGYDVFGADIWSLGCVFYSLLFGKLAFDIPGADRFNVEMELNMKIQKEEPDYTNMLGSGPQWDLALNLVQSMLNKSVDERANLADLKNHEFFKN